MFASISLYAVFLLMPLKRPRRCAAGQLFAFAAILPRAGRAAVKPPYERARTICAPPPAKCRLITRNKGLLTACYAYLSFSLSPLMFFSACTLYIASSSSSAAHLHPLAYILQKYLLSFRTTLHI